MAMDPRALDQYGTPFWVTHDLTVASTVLVVPKPAVTHPTPIAGGAGYELSGLVITGIHYHLHSSADGDGFEIVSVDDQVNPTASPNTELTIFKATNHAKSVSTNSINCFIPLHRAGLSKVSPDTGVLNGSDIKVLKIGTPVDGSTLIIEGFHTTHSFGEYAATGSPQTFA